MVLPGLYLSEVFEVSYKGKPLKVATVYTPSLTLFFIAFGRGDQTAFTHWVDEQGRECWLEDGTPTARAQKIGLQIESHFL